MPTTTKLIDDEMAELRAKVDKLTGDVAGLTKSLADVVKSQAGRAADEVHEGAKTTTGGISEKAKAAKGVIAWQAFAWDELARLLNETFARTNYQWKKHEDDFVEWWDGVPHIAPQSEAPSEIVYWLGVLNAERQDVTARKNPNDLDDFVRKFADGKVVAARAVERLHRKIRVRDVRS